MMQTEYIKLSNEKLMINVHVRFNNIFRHM